MSDISETGLTFNQFLVTGDEPFLFHCGPPHSFGQVSDGITRRRSPEEVAWISFGDVEADERGAMSQFLDAVPNAEITHSPPACLVSLTDMCNRPPAPVTDEPLDIDNHRLRFIAVSHVPHNCAAGSWFDETTTTLLAGDVFTHTGGCPGLAEFDGVAEALDAESVFHLAGITTNLMPTLEQPAELNRARAGQR
jgi:flavorubredoxin